MIMNIFDKWLTAQPRYNPIEVTANDYQNDKELWEIAPADETVCDRCEEVIGFYLYEDPETTADLPAFRTFFIMDEDAELLFCEDCVEEINQEVE